MPWLRKRTKLSGKQIRRQKNFPTKGKIFVPALIPLGLRNVRTAWEKQEEDLSRPITPEKVKEFANSEFARNQIKVIGKLIENDQNPTPLG